MSNKTKLIPANSTELSTDALNIQSLIYVFRGKQVMIDSDLASLYRVETGNLNRAVKRNINRFPEDFMFRLTLNEAQDISRSKKTTLKEMNDYNDSLRSKFLTLNEGRGHNIKYLPFWRWCI